jgi:uncharacterized tannase-like protein DUF6351
LIRHFTPPGWKSVVLGTGILLMVGLSSVPANADQPSIELTSLSNRPDMISGGDALVRVSVSQRVRAAEVTLTLNGKNVTSQFHSEPGGRSLVGLVDGLKLGANQLTATAERSRETLTLTDYPSTGPIFSGPRQSPYFCETVQSGLGAPLDDNCSVATTYQYFYRTTAGQFTALADPKTYPADLAYTTIYGGKTVPYLVRVESGTINRSIYRIAILDDPANAPAGTWHPGAGWNGKLRYNYGPGCGYGHHQGNNQATAVLDNTNLSRGFAVTTSTLNSFTSGCDDVLSAETTMMVKEHFSEQYGVPIYTMGQGGSGGSMQQHLISQNYPGLLDGIVPSGSFPDGQTVTQTPTDSALLNLYFASSGISFTDAQQTAVSGFGVIGTLRNQWGAQYQGGTNGIYPTTGCGSIIPVEYRYDPVTNRTGVRCTTHDNLKTYLGTDPKTGFGQRPLDNVGIQYGLSALNAGTITVDQFLDLNAKIGGWDVDGNQVPQRTVATMQAVQNGYLSGRVLTGKGVDLPILDLRAYADLGDGNVHTRYHTFEYQARLIQGNGDADNLVMWAYQNPAGVDVSGLSTDAMNQWLDNLVADKSNASYAKKVERAKPASLVDGCWTNAGVRINEAATLDSSAQCNQLFPVYRNPRTAAGAPISDSIVKCRTKPVDRADYTVAFTSAQWAKLKQVFNQGACDYAKPGYGQNLTAKPWQSWGPAAVYDKK